MVSNLVVFDHYDGAIKQTSFPHVMPVHLKKLLQTCLAVLNFYVAYLKTRILDPRSSQYFF
jgi:hypothetical protein